MLAAAETHMDRRQVKHMTALRWCAICGREVGRIKGSKDVYLLISRTCKFPDMIQLKDLGMEKLPRVIQADPIKPHKSLKRETFLTWSERWGWRQGQGVWCADLEDRGRGLKLRKAVASRYWERQGRRLLPAASERHSAFLTPWLWPRETRIGHLSRRTVR